MHDAIVVGAGVVGAATAFHLAALGARRVLLLERRRVGEGTGAMSSGILRTHYSVPSNVELARRSFAVYEGFAAALGDPEAGCGLVRCGYLIAAPEGPRRDALAASLAAQQALGIRVERLTPAEAAERLPIATFDDAALIGFEPDAGFADPHLVATGYARAARRLGATVREGVAVRGLLRGPQGGAAGRDGHVTGVLTDAGPLAAGVVVSCQNIWATELAAWTGIAVPLHAERHAVLALQGGLPYTAAMPVFKDLALDAMPYFRSYGGTRMLASEGTGGEVLAEPDDRQGAIGLDTMARIAEMAAARFPSFADAGVAATWTGVYDVTPDWNPVLGPVGGVPGLIVAFGFSGHGFKLAPAVGRVLAQCALGLPTDVPLAPYAIERFAAGALLQGRYGAGAVS
jgi:glycine/D-amino acid oxidase-like deaminating enzyme